MFRISNYSSSGGGVHKRLTAVSFYLVSDQTPRKMRGEILFVQTSFC